MSYCFKSVLIWVCLFAITRVSFGQEDTVRSSVSLLFLGDIMGHDSQIKSAYQSDSESYDYSDVFKYLQEEIAAADIAIGNLEVTLGGPPYKGYPTFSSPDALALAAKDAGIDVLVTANNHSADRRSKGIIRTIRVLDSLGIEHTGTFENAADRKANNLLVMEKGGMRIGMLNYTFSTNGIPVLEPTIVNMIERKQMAMDILAAKKDSLDKLIVFVHWGREYESIQHRSQESLASFLMDEGVDMVIGAHPHVLQPMVWERQGNKDQLIVYSLGNFVSNQRDTGRDGGGMFHVELAWEEDSVVVENAAFQLTWVYKAYEEGKVHFHVIPCDRFADNEAFFKTKGSWDSYLAFLKGARSLLEKKNRRIGELRYATGRWYYALPRLKPMARLGLETERESSGFLRKSLLK